MGAAEAIWRTTDLGSAAYALGKGLALQKVDRDEGRVTFVFDDPKAQGDAYRIEYTNSSERKFDQNVRTLKDLAYGGRDREERKTKTRAR